MPARRYRLNGKGEIKVVYDADFVLSDYETIIDHADIMDPLKLNEGNHQVYIDGKLVLEDNESAGVWAGKYLK